MNNIAITFIEKQNTTKNLYLSKRAYKCFVVVIYASIGVIWAFFLDVVNFKKKALPFQIFLGGLFLPLVPFLIWYLCMYE